VTTLTLVLDEHAKDTPEINTARAATGKSKGVRPRCKKMEPKFRQ
jgi:hypothetical protein